jgi:3-oxoacyl-[acyl-carrier protein] reductase
MTTTSTTGARTKDRARPYKTMIITGAGRGIGRAVALRAAREGYTVGLLSNDEARLAETRQLIDAIGGAADMIVLDVRDIVGVQRAIDLFVERHGTLDALINSAGVAYFGGVETCTMEQWETTLAINLTGYFGTCRAALPHMKKAGRGSIINMSSIWGKKGSPTMLAYSVSKFGIEGLTESVAEEARPFGVRVSSLVLDKVDTGFRENMTKFVSISAEQEARMISADDVADSVAYLLSTSARCLPLSISLQAFQWR